MASTVIFEAHLRNLLEKAVKSQAGEQGGNHLPPISLEIPRQRQHGDLSVSVALQLASSWKRPPMQIAQGLKSQLEELVRHSWLSQAIDRIEVLPPGFINFFLSPAFLQEVLAEVLRQGSAYGRSTLGKNVRAMVEFVSANPTGSLSVAHGRQAVVGDAMASLLDFAGWQVSREYYLNDEGTQIELLGQSILARAKEAVGMEGNFPENGYKGQYIREYGKAFLDKYGKESLTSNRALDLAKAYGIQQILGGIREDLERCGVAFDVWFSQKSLNRWNYLGRTLNRLKKSGFLYEKEGAWWLKSTDFGDDKDRVVIRSDGRLTYIAADIAYHRRKFERGFQFLVNLWGPDHHGYIPRLKAAVQALGFDPVQLQVRIVQLCTLKRGSQTIPMSTREGEFITSTQVVQEVGKDAARFFFLMRKADAHLEFDLELAKKHSLENPVYYIQYAHARICSILSNRPSGSAKSEGLELLQTPEEMAILRVLREFPGVIEIGARTLEPFGITVYLQGLAEAFHRFYDRHRVLGDDPKLTAARLKLIQGVQMVLKIGLGLLGVSAPDKM